MWGSFRNSCDIFVIIHKHSSYPNGWSWSTYHIYCLHHLLIIGAFDIPKIPFITKLFSYGFMVCLVKLAWFQRHSTPRRVCLHMCILSSTLYFLTFAFCCIVLLYCESHLHTLIVWNILIFLLSSCWTTLLSVLDKNLVSALANLTSLEICRQNPLDVLQLPDTRIKLEYFMREIYIS